MSQPLDRAVSWLVSASREARADLPELGREFYERATGRPLPGGWPIPALPQPGLDQILTRLLCPSASDRYPSIESLRWDLEEQRWLQPDFVAASGITRRQPAEPAHIGREALLEQLMGPGLTMVVGEAGLGKTRLLDEAQRRAMALGQTIHRTECLERTHQVFQPFQDLVARLASQPQRWPALKAELGEWLPAALRLFPILRCLQDQAAEEPRADDFVAERNRQACLRLMSALAPGLLIVDDLHWADSEVLAVLELLPFPVLGGSRIPLEQAKRNLVLQPLTAEEVHRLARSMCGPVECAEVYGWSQGHPLLAAALVRNLCDTGGLIYHPEGWRRSQGEPAWGPLSPTLEQLLRQRSHRLPAVDQAVLKQAAMLGRRFPIELLEATDPLPALLEGERLGLVCRAGEATWDFTHDLIWQELHRLTSDHERAEFHGRVAERLLQSAHPSAAALAHHLWESGRHSECLNWSVRAAEQALRQGALETAVLFFERATRIAPEEHRYWFELGEVHRLLGRYPAARSALKSALAISPNTLARAQTCGKLGETAWRAGDLRLAVEHFRQGLQELGLRVPSGRSRWLALLRELWPASTRARSLTPGESLAARMLDQFAYAAVYTDGLASVWTNLRGLRLTAGSDGRERGILLASHAVMVLYIPQLLARARRCIAEALEILTRHGDDHDLAGTEARHASILLFTGELEPALSTAQGALSRLVQSGDRYDVRMCRYNVAYCLYWLGHIDEAQALALAAWDDCRRAQDWLAAGYAARVLAVLGLVPAGFYEHYAQPIQQPHVETLRLEINGILQLVRGRPEAAVIELEKALALSTRLGTHLDRVPQATWLATAYRQQAELAPLAQRAELYRNGLKAAGIAVGLARAYRIHLPQALRERGWCELGLGRPTLAFEESLDWAVRLKMKLQAVLTEADRMRAGLAPLRELPLISHWQLHPVEVGAQRLADRFDLAVQHARSILESMTPAQVLVRAEEAAQALVGAEYCQAVPGGEPLSGPLVERPPQRAGVRSSMLIPLGMHWGRPLNLACLHRHVPDRFGEEDVHLAKFLGTVIGAAIDNATMLEELRGREQWQTRLFEAVPVGVASLDQEGRILQANSALHEMLGDDLVGRLLSDFIHRGGQAEERYLGRHGNLIWADRRIARLGPERAVVSLSDVSWRRLARVAAFQEQERRLLGIEVHDVSQPLVGLAYQLQAEGGRESAAMAQRLLNDLRGLMFDLRSPNLEDFDLVGGLQDLMSEVCAMSGLAFEMDLESELESVTGLTALFAYRIAVEGMSNVRRHARASRVFLRLRVVGNQLRGSLWDDGSGGGNSSSSGRRYGLEGMAERAGLLGGWARLRRSENRGSLLHFRLLLEETE